jgi:hypothetical protein
MSSNSSRENPDNAANNRILFRRLLLAKELFLHGLDHSKRPGALNKMIAVHNFHNAVEVALRSILLKYEIRAEKHLNIEFEAMLNEIDKHQVFKDRELKLPYRQELRNLNQIRNLVQHHAIEPESTTLDDLRVFTRRALEMICESYFQINFQSLTPLDMVDDDDLRNLLCVSFSALDKKQLKDALVIGSIAYKLAESSVLGSVAEPALHFVPRFEDRSRDYTSTREDDSRWKDLASALESINNKLQEVSTLTGLSSTGMNLADRNRFLREMPNIRFAINGHPIIQMMDRQHDEDEIRSLLNLALDTIVDWQMLGLNPIVPTWGRESAKKLVQDSDALTVMLFKAPSL